MRNKLLTLSSITLLAVTSTYTQAASQKGLLDRLEGSYQSRHLVAFVSSGELTFEEGGGSVVKITSIKGKPDHAKIVVSSLQSNGNSCELEGVAQVESDKLVYQETIADAGQAAEKCTLRISEVGTSISLEDVNSVCRKTYCGVGAGLAISVPKNSRVKNGKISTTLLPNESETLCFSRGYGTDHLKTNPKQKLSYLRISITNNENGLKAIGIKASGADKAPEDATLYFGGGNCYALNSTNGKCGLESDSGQFELQNNADGSIFLRLTTGISLFEINTQNPDADPLDGKQLVLSGSDRDNNLFKLYPSACEDDI